MALGTKSIFDFVLLRLKRIRSSELESALKFLNYQQSTDLLFYLEHCIRNNQELELCSRASIFLIKQYEKQIVGSGELQPLLASLVLHQKKHFRDLR
mmetsp:Transcript_28805/g.21458  ORF Transcript_28805/g.21458 Transcript_28805/m.21458 type:complete len:97 (+) Transcript_28805:604-894(+)